MNNNNRMNEVQITNEVKTYGFIISLDEVKKKKLLLKNCKPASDSTSHTNNVFVNTRCFNLEELKYWLHFNLGMSVDYVNTLKPKLYDTKYNKVLIDLTRVVSKLNNSSFVNRVDEMRNRIDNIIKQKSITASNIKDYIKPVMNNGKVDSLLLEFTVTKNMDNIYVTKPISIDEVVGNENGKQASIRKSLQAANYKGILFNTGYLVPVNSNTDDLLFFKESLTADELIHSGLAHLPYYKNEAFFDTNYVSLLDILYSIK